ncbi:glycosyltransferase family 2 protein [Dinoroseobacter sp. S76]|uniref:glycosyltransferase family 2 protein n=1 Tax=Dinoroseobacter sp. S76 TaxID=3415124 RepID=UPI003C7A44DD
MTASLRQAYKLRWKRRGFLWRAWRKRSELVPVADRTGDIPQEGVLCFACLRNEAERLPYWLSHYRALGVSHFLVVDNGSTDGSLDLLSAAPDVSVWRTSTSYKAARFGMDWLTTLLRRHGRDRWCLTVDLDELLVYPDHEHRPLPDLVAELDRQGRRAFGALMVELYPKGPLGAQSYSPGQDPTQILSWFDATPYRTTPQPHLKATLYQGGVRERLFFGSEPRRAPTLNKIPLVKWHWRWAYMNSTHSLLPPSLNAVFSTPESPRLSGALLHTKFLPSVVARSAEEKARQEHFGESALFDAYYDGLIADPDLWCPESCAYEGPAQLEALGFMSRSPGWGDAPPHIVAKAKPR